MQQARNLLMDLSDVGTRVKFMIHDRDVSFTTAFDEVFRAAGTRTVRSAIQAPRMNSSWNGGSAAAAANCSTGLWYGTSATL